MTRAGRTTFERHFQTGALSLIVAFCLWGAAAIYQANLFMAGAKATLTAIEARLGTLERVAELASNDRYRAQDAAKDFDIRDKQIERIQARLNSLEQRYNDR